MHLPNGHVAKPVAKAHGILDKLKDNCEGKKYV